MITSKVIAIDAGEAWGIALYLEELARICKEQPAVMPGHEENIRRQALAIRKGILGVTNQSEPFNIRVNGR